VDVHLCCAWIGTYGWLTSGVVRPSEPPPLARAVPRGRRRGPVETGAKKSFFPLDWPVGIIDSGVAVLTEPGRSMMISGLQRGNQRGRKPRKRS
jgi:hypothetical protein